MVVRTEGFLSWFRFLVSILCLLGHTQQCSGFTPDFVVRDHSWQGSGDHVWHQGSNPDWLYANQEPYLLYYLYFQPNILAFFYIISWVIFLGGVYLWFGENHT